MNPTPILIGAVAGLISAYLCGAAIAWDVDPGHWTMLGRGLIVLFALLLGIVGAVFGAAIQEEYP